MSWNFDRYLLKVGTHEKSYRTFVGDAIYVSFPGLIDPRVNFGWLFNFRKRCKNIDCYVGCVTSGIVLLKHNVVHVILFNFWKPKFVKYWTVMLAIDRNGISLLIFEEKWPNNATVPKSAPNSHSLWAHQFLSDEVWIFRASNATILLIYRIELLPKQSKMYWKIGLIEWGTVRPAMAVV